MLVDLHFTPDTASESALRGKTAIVIDVLRASTTICTALQNGCREVLPFASVEAAVEKRAQFDKNTVLLCGERAGLKIEGFDLGNSPDEYTPNVVAGRTLIFASTNGSRAILKCAEAAVVYVCGFVNLSLAQGVAGARQGEIVIVCAGKLGQFALEDALCAGMLIEGLVKSGQYYVNNDAARAGLLLYQQESKRLHAAVAGAEHARYLTEIGFGADIVTATRIDSIAVLPMLDDTRIIGRKFD